MHWYGVRCVFHHAKRSGEDGALYEERITLWQAESFEGAIQQAEREALDYASSNACQFLEFSDAFQIGSEFIGQGAEVFSLMRSSLFGPSDYISTFYDTGKERRKSL